MICDACKNNNHFNCVNNNIKDDSWCDCEDVDLTEEEKQELGKKNYEKQNKK